MQGICTKEMVLVLTFALKEHLPTLLIISPNAQCAITPVPIATYQSQNAQDANLDIFQMKELAIITIHVLMGFMKMEVLTVVKNVTTLANPVLKLSTIAYHV